MWDYRPLVTRHPSALGVAAKTEAEARISRPGQLLKDLSDHYHKNWSDFGWQSCQDVLPWSSGKCKVTMDVPPQLVYYVPLASEAWGSAALPVLLLHRFTCMFSLCVHQN